MTAERPAPPASSDAPPVVSAKDAAPPEAAKIALEYLSGKVKKPAGDVLLLSVLAGAYIAFGSILYIVTSAGGGAYSGPQHLIAGASFAVGLVLVVIAGAELFTGDTMLVINRMRDTLDAATMWRFWALVYGGNLVGALLIAALFVAAGGHMPGEGAVGLSALEIAATKTGKGWVALLAGGILANMLVCLAIWVTQAARTVPGKILALLLPVAAFVAAGFEHSVANMSIIPIALLVKAFAAPEFWTGISHTAADFPTVTLGGFVRNLVVVTLGNIFGGASIGLSYWFAYLKKRDA
ncbi:formate/nitrite transporter family protein [Aureimonas pseudogalii]|uniref:Formate transporter n=1 Tax=Aureimonas pseudogalii TaxID=1744844 RepID=A0A7W6EAJ7_9HYPH|nr:formate/nitrite transporter family protein [Aureimonas pseudogalii]MBB3997329.1 formate transporter [Aureimonas pseudogalii]